MQRSGITGQPACIVHRTFPSALDAEVMDPGDATDSEKACVAWLAGGVSMATTEYLAFADGAERAVAVRNAEAAQHAGARLSSSNIGKVLRSRDLATTYKRSSYTRYSYSR